MKNKAYLTPELKPILVNAQDSLLLGLSDTEANETKPAQGRSFMDWEEEKSGFDFMW